MKMSKAMWEALVQPAIHIKIKERKRDNLAYALIYVCCMATKLKLRKMVIKHENSILPG